MSDFQGMDPALMALALAAAEDAIMISVAEPLGPEPHPKVVFVSDGYTRMTGYRADELLGRSPRTSQGAGTDRATLDRIRAQMERWEPSREELLNYKKDGTPFWVEMDIRPVVDAQGWVTHWISIQRDVTARRLEQAAALRQAQDFARACQRAQIGVWRWEVGSGRITCSTPASGAVALPLNGSETTIDAAVEAIAASDRDRIRTAIESVAATGQQAEFELQIPSPGGVPRFFWANAQPESASDGSVTAVFGLWQDISDRQQLEASLLQSATHDLLTTLPNRDAVLASGSAVAVAARSQSLLCLVILFDLCTLGNINSVLGIAVGDFVLQTVARRLQRACPRGAEIGRFSNSQFLMVGAFADQDEADAAIGAISAQVAEPVNTATGNVEIVIRTAVADLEDPDASVEDATKHAGIALTEAGAQGSSGIRWYTPKMGQLVEQRQRQLAQVRSAIADGRLVPFYQPKVRLSDGALLGFEALLRIEEGGDILLPAAFRHALDDMATVRGIGRAMIGAVLRQLQNWNEANVEFGAVAINLSAHDLRQSGFADEFLALLDRHGVRPDQIQIEVTEDALLNSQDDDGYRQLWTLNEAGLSVALDDFGTGYASLKHLQSLPINTLKIDSSFVSRIDKYAHDKAIVSAVASIGGALGLKTVAEGVETAEQAVLARDLGCTAMQGWFTGRPLSADETRDCIEQWPAHRQALLQKMLAPVLLLRKKWLEGNLSFLPPPQ